MLACSGDLYYTQSGSAVAEMKDDACTSAAVLVPHI